MTCPAGRWPDIATHTCKVCMSNCATCTTCDVSNVCTCTSCLLGKVWFANDNTCRDACPVGFFNLSGTCSPCAVSCKTCRSSAAFCLSCYNAVDANGDGIKYLYENTCLTSCPIQYYGNPTTNICQHCVINCDDCTTNNKYVTTKCEICASGYDIDQNGQCGCSAS